MYDKNIKKRYVAYFDILGFKSAIKRNHLEACKALKILRKCMDDALSCVIQEKSGIFLPETVKGYIFSDNVILFSSGDSDFDYTSIITIASQFFAYSLHRCLPLRGGIAFGDFFVDTNLHLFCGDPLVKAYEIGEEAQWLGITVDEHIFNEYPKHNKLVSNKNPLIIEWDVPFKKNKIIKTPVINWPTAFRGNFKKLPPYTINEFYEAFVKLYGEYETLSEDVKKKYENTLFFLNKVLDKYL